MAKQVVWSYRALEDRKNILNYWKQRNGSITYSKKLNHLFKEAIRILKNFPQVGKPSKPNYPLFIDWTGVPVIASSFADEFMGKLFLELGPLSFSAIIKNKGMEPIVMQLLDKAIFQRLAQQ